MTQRPEDDIAFIEALARVLADNGLGEVEVARETEGGELHVRLSRAASAPAAPVAAPVAATVQHVAVPPPAEAGGAPAAPPAADGDAAGAIPSPMVGTVYLSPEPGADPFVSEGDTVREGQTLLIVEAMKTMNQIPAPRAGKVGRLMVADGEPVEYGSPLLTIV